MIMHDRSPVSVVTRCTECPFWSAFSFTIEEAYRRAERHAVVVHDVEPARAHEPARKRATRRAKRQLS